ncbi:MAG: hypothetical protein Kow0031_15780 [Anaerolineae bacterium]
MQMQMQVKSYEEWVTSVPEVITAGPVWRFFLGLSQGSVFV